MNDRPDARELLAAVQLFLERDLLPTLSDARLKFQTLIASHVLDVASREMLEEDQLLRNELVQLHGLLHLPQSNFTELREQRQQVRDLNAELCRRIRTGVFDAPEPARVLFAFLREQTRAKLAVANPKMLGQ